MTTPNGNAPPNGPVRRETAAAAAEAALSFVALVAGTTSHPPAGDWPTAARAIFREWAGGDELPTDMAGLRKLAFRVAVKAVAELGRFLDVSVSDAYELCDGERPVEAIIALAPGFAHKAYHGGTEMTLYAAADGSSQIGVGFFPGDLARVIAKVTEEMLGEPRRSIAKPAEEGGPPDGP